MQELNHFPWYKNILFKYLKLHQISTQSIQHLKRDVATNRHTTQKLLHLHYSPKRFPLFVDSSFNIFVAHIFISHSQSFYMKIILSVLYWPSSWPIRVVQWHAPPHSTRASSNWGLIAIPTNYASYNSFYT